MVTRRMLKAAEAIREVVSMAILTEIRDPRVENVTVTGVEVTSDMRNAKVLISVMGDEGRQQLCLRGLSNAAGFLQAKIARRIETRYTPRLTFELDQGVKKSLEVGRILHELALEREQLESERSHDDSALADQGLTDAPAATNKTDSDQTSPSSELDASSQNSESHEVGDLPDNPDDDSKSKDAG